jgi:hypothetical protein
MIILLITVMGVIVLFFCYFGYSIRNDQFMQIKEYASFIADKVEGRLVRWSFLSPKGAFMIVGRYQGYNLKMYLYLNEAKIFIFSDRLPKQKRILLTYPEIADGILQIGKSLSLNVQHQEIGDPQLKRTRIIEGLERLLSKTKQLEG